MTQRNKNNDKDDDNIDDVLAEYLNDTIVDEPEGEDLYGSDVEKDYDSDPELDTYEDDGIDNNKSIKPLDASIRRKVDLKIQQQKKREYKKLLAEKATGTNNRIGLAILSSDEEDEDDSDDDILFPISKKRKLNDTTAMDVADSLLWGDMSDVEMSDYDSDSEQDIDFGKRKGPLREWLVLDRIRKQIHRQFKNFLQTYEDSKGNTLYSSRIEEACLNNRQSLVINFNHLKELYPYLALCLADAPTEMLEIFDDVCMAVALSHFPYYKNVSTEMKARIIGLPEISLRDLRQIHLNVLIKVRGVVTRRTAVFPQLSLAKYNCAKCQTLLGPFKQSIHKEMRPTGSCPQCQSKGPYILNAQETIYHNYQRLSLQESPGSVPAGRLPRSKEVIILGDLIDQVRPGEEIEVTGIFRHNYDLRLNRNQGFPVFATIIEANYVSKTEDLLSGFRLDENDIKEIRNLSRDEQIGEKIIRSIAPSIYGHEDIKTAIALSLFGGNAKELIRKSTNDSSKKQTHHRIRGDINVLLMGDPGTAKSQFLKYVEKTGNRTVYTTGQGASAVGLTAAVRKDPATKEWTLEGGALVLADKGVCLIDEFDKMTDKDRTSIHEAMEQQSISISKAGIVTSLQARCAIIAAANPIRGRYDQALTFAQNVDLTEPILSRFDILCTVRDLVDPIQDEQLASFVVDSHIKSHPHPEEELLNLLNAESTKKKSQEQYLPQETLRKYIIYAKKYCFPKLHNIDRDKIAKVYAELRKLSRRGGGLPMGVRHLESMLRIAEANARMHLRSYVREDDVNLAISVIVRSFIQAQKLSVAKMLRTHFSKYISNSKDSNELLLHLLQQLMKEEQNHQRSKLGVRASDRIEIQLSQLETKAREVEIISLHNFFSSKQFRNNGYILDNLRKVIVKDF